MATVYFKCNCAKSLATDVSDAGGQVQCPDCGTTLCIPLPDYYWTCACGEELAAPENLVGAAVRCAACAAEHTVPARLRLQRDKPPPNEPQSDVPRVPVGRPNDIRCPKCDYLCAPVLARCPQCQNYLRKGPVILRRCLAVARAIFIVGLGWFLASHFSRISGYVKGLFGLILE